MTIFSFSRSFLLGWTLVFLLSTTADAQTDGSYEFPLIFGRSTKGTWKNGTIDYEIVYYGSIHYADGPLNQLDCVLTKWMEGIFVSLDDTAEDPVIQAVTPAQADQVTADHAAANPEEQKGPLAGGISMSISGGQGPFLSSPTTSAESVGNTVDNNTANSTNDASTAQSRQNGNQPEPTVAAMYHQRSDSDLGERGGLQYEVDINLGLYIQGVYINRFDDVVESINGLDATPAPKELEAFVLEQAKTLVRPEVIPVLTMDDDFFLAAPLSFNQEVLALREIEMSIIMECIIPLNGELAGDNPSLENTTIVGRSIAGEFQENAYNYSVFFEFYQLRGVATPQQKQCFGDAVDSLFVTTPTILKMTPDQVEFAQSVIQEEHEADRLTNRSSFYRDQAGAMVSMSMGDFTVAYQKGAFLTINGQNVEAYGDYINPPALEAFVNSIADPVQEDLKKLFPVNNTSQLKELFAVMFSHMGTFKPQKDGTGIYIPLFMEHLIYCVDPLALENYTAFPTLSGLSEDSNTADEAPNVLDEVFVSPDLDDVDGQELEEFVETNDAADSLTSQASNNRVVEHAMMPVMLLIFIVVW